MDQSIDECQETLMMIEGKSGLSWQLTEMGPNRLWLTVYESYTLANNENHFNYLFYLKFIVMNLLNWKNCLNWNKNMILIIIMERIVWEVYLGKFEKHLQGHENIQLMG